MSEMLSYCGYRCDFCAARSDDPKLRQKLIEGWRKFFGHEMYTVENVHCDGCKSSGRRADQGCPVRPCAIEKGVETCAHCDEYPCDKLTPLIGSRESFFKRFPDAPEVEYNLAARQFASKERLDIIREDLGKHKQSSQSI